MSDPISQSRTDISLKPCPFCGGSATVLREGNRRHSAQVSCDECGVVWEGPNTAGWNLREIAAEKEESERLERVKAKAAVSAELKRFNAWEHYRKVRTDLYGAGWEDVDEAANHEHIEALEATVDAALNCAMSAIVAPTPATEASSTPRTDAFWAGCSDEFGIDFARQLKSELAEKQKTLDGWLAANALGGWIDDLRTKRSALANSACNEMDGRGEGDEGVLAVPLPVAKWVIPTPNDWNLFVVDSDAKK